MNCEKGYCPGCATGDCPKMAELAQFGEDAYEALRCLLIEAQGEIKALKAELGDGASGD